MVYENRAKDADSMLKKYEESLAKPNAGWNKLKNVVGNTAEDRLENVNTYLVYHSIITCSRSKEKSNLQTISWLMLEMTIYSPYLL